MADSKDWSGFDILPARVTFGAGNFQVTFTARLVHQTTIPQLMEKTTVLLRLDPKIEVVRCDDGLNMPGFTASDYMDKAKELAAVEIARRTQ